MKPRAKLLLYVLSFSSYESTSLMSRVPDNAPVSDFCGLLFLYKGYLLPF